MIESEVLNDFKKMSEMIEQKDKRIHELENQLYVANTKLNLKKYAPVFCSLADRECEYMGKEEILNKAFELACEKLVEVFGECPYSNMDIDFPNYCNSDCHKHEQLLCWDKYFEKLARNKIKNKIPKGE